MNLNPSSLRDKQKPLGVIDTFSAGISVVMQHPWLLLLPILLDLFFWMGPPISLEPALVDTVTAPFDPQGPNAAELSQGLATDLSLFYEGLQSQLRAVNLWTFLVPAVLFWPTVAAGEPAEAAAEMASGMQVDSAGTVLLIIVGLSLLGFWLNMLWLHVVARGMRDKPLFAKLGELLRNASRHALRFVGLILLLLVAFIGVLVPLSVAVALVTFLLPGVGQFLASLVTLGAMWLVLWLGIHFYFTAGAIVLDDAGIIQSLGNSVRIVRRFFWSAFGFVLLSTLLSTGFQLIWSPMSAASPAGYATSIIGNAALGTAIVAAMFIFYKDRVRLVKQEGTP
ncbi:MAG: hypothetical protein M3220_02900 [Chloroflexota bacterium]|nr:hypothetical protein [Chloroflexota bacterium]